MRCHHSFSPWTPVVKASKHLSINTQKMGQVYLADSLDPQRWEEVSGERNKRCLLQISKTRTEEIKCRCFNKSLRFIFCLIFLEKHMKMRLCIRKLDLHQSVKQSDLCKYHLCTSAYCLMSMPSTSTVMKIVLLEHNVGHVKSTFDAP